MRCVSAPKPDQWFVIDFKDKRIKPTHYTLRHYSTWDLEALRNWRLEASNDGKTWTVLRVHTDDQALHGKGCSHTWSIDGANGSYSQLTVFVVGVGCFLAGALEFDIAAIGRADSELNGFCAQAGFCPSTSCACRLARRKSACCSNRRSCSSQNTARIASKFG